MQGVPRHLSFLLPVLMIVACVHPQDMEREPPDSGRYTLWRPQSQGHQGERLWACRRPTWEQAPPCRLGERCFQMLSHGSCKGESCPIPGVPPKALPARPGTCSPACYNGSLVPGTSVSLGEEAPLSIMRLLARLPVALPASSRHRQEEKRAQQSCEVWLTPGSSFPF